jgi:tRNA-splicing ligase RtcB
MWDGPLNKIDEFRWEIPTSYKQGMRVPGLIYSDAEMLRQIREDRAAEQVANVAFLPGIIGHSMAMPDIHWGYGFPIGGVAATAMKDGVVSPGGVGYDINCGVRLLRTNLIEQDVKPRIHQLVDHLFEDVPSGLGSQGKIRLNQKDLDQVLSIGARWAISKGLGRVEDLDVTEETGTLKSADPDKVSDHARKRGLAQSGTLGSGNHFLEVQVVREVFDKTAAEAMGVFEPGQILVMIHTGSRGLGHQVCDDYLRIMGSASHRYNILLPDRELACAPLESPEGKDYLAAMAAAANFAWTNRQCIAHWVRESFESVFKLNSERLGMDQVYDVAHNIAKIERHVVDGKETTVCVHRKGATRAFPAGHKDIPQRYSAIGQPVLIPGDMGRRSFVAVGTERALRETFGSTCHGAGRVQSRGAAKRGLQGVDIGRRLAQRGIVVRAQTPADLAEEASEAYKDVSRVVEICQQAGISHKVIMVEPLGVVKG